MLIILFIIKVHKRISSSSDVDNGLFPLQIEFLNSVIVDLQRKNEELKGKLETMAAAALNGNNPSEMDNYDG